MDDPRRTLVVLSRRFDDNDESVDDMGEERHDDGRHRLVAAMMMNRVGGAGLSRGRRRGPYPAQPPSAGDVV